MSSLDDRLEAAREADGGREEPLDALRQTRAYAEYKVYGDGRFRDLDKENLRTKYLNIIIRASNAERQMLKDQDLEELAERIEQLEERQNRGKYR